MALNKYVVCITTSVCENEEVTATSAVHAGRKMLGKIDKEADGFLMSVRRCK